jgi:hypothetical protein
MFFDQQKRLPLLKLSTYLDQQRGKFLLEIDAVNLLFIAAVSG